jgi:hypothetical protein
MSDELQVQTPTGLQVQGSPTFQQTGSGNTQIGYIGQQINYITMGGMPQPIWHFWSKMRLQITRQRTLQ